MLSNASSFREMLFNESVYLCVNDIPVKIISAQSYQPIPTTLKWCCETAPSNTQLT
jgi:hypothetical protein